MTSDSIAATNVPGAPRPAAARGPRFSDETKLTALLFLFSFFISGVPRVFTQNAAYSLFIDAYGAKAVPYAYMAQAICVPIAGWIYLMAEHRLKLRPLLLATLSFNAAILVAFRLGLFAHVPGVAAATIVWFEIEFVLSSLLLWGLANQLMTLRQGKRLFGFIVAGEPVAIIICGLGTPFLMRFLSVPDLFLLSAAGAVAGILLVLYITANYKPTESAESHGEEAADAEEDGAAQGQAWWKNRYIAVMVAMIFLSQLVYFFIDETFYLSVEHRFPEEEAMASFLGVYSAIMGFISLGVSLFVVGPLVRRFGVRGGLITLPALLLVGTVAAVVTGEFYGVAGALFFVLVGNKIADQSFRYTLDKTTSVTLYQPLPAGQRMKLQAFLESMVEPAAGGIAGLLLSFLLHQLHFTAIGVSAVIASIVLVWLGFVVVVSSGYAQALRKAVAGRRFDLNSGAQMSDAEMATIQQSLSSPHLGEILYSFEVLNAQADGLTVPLVTKLLDNGAPAVRTAAARWFEARHSEDALGLISEKLRQETDPGVRGALIAAQASCGGDNAIELITPYLDATNEAEQLGAYQGLIQHGGVEGVIVAGNRLIADIQSDDAGRRCFAAEVMRQVGSHLFYRPLMRLLDDPNEEVRAAALLAAGAIHAPPLWPAIVESLKSTRLTQPAIAAIGAIGDPLLERLAVLYDDETSSRSTCRAVVQACGVIGSPAAAAWLMERLEEPRHEWHQAILAALWRCEYRIGPADLPRVKTQLLREIKTSLWMLRAWQDCSIDSDANALVARALSDEISNSQETIFHILGLMVTKVDMRDARTAFMSGGATARSYVLEILDNVLDNDIKAALLSYLEPETLEAKFAALGREPVAADDGTTVHDVAAIPEIRLNAWAPASALYALSQSNSPAALKLAQGAVDAVEPVLRETARWILDGSKPFGEERDMLLTIEKVLILRSVGIFSQVREGALTQAAQAVKEVKIAAGDPVFQQGDFGDALYIIVSGRLRVHVGDRTLAELGERQVVGEMAALDPEPRSASISAMEDSLLLRMSSDHLERLIADDIQVARGIIQELCKRLRVANEAPAPKPAGSGGKPESAEAAA